MELSRLSSAAKAAQRKALRLPLIQAPSRAGMVIKTSGTVSGRRMMAALPIKPGKRRKRLIHFDTRGRENPLQPDAAHDGFQRLHQIVTISSALAKRSLSQCSKAASRVNARRIQEGNATATSRNTARVPGISVAGNERADKRDEDAQQQSQADQADDFLHMIYAV